MGEGKLILINLHQSKLTDSLLFLFSSLFWNSIPPQFFAPFLLPNQLEYNPESFLMIWPPTLASYNTHHRIFQLAGYPLFYFGHLQSKILSSLYCHNNTKNKPLLMWKNGMIGANTKEDIWFWIEMKQLDYSSSYRLSATNSIAATTTTTTTSGDRTIVELKVRGPASNVAETTRFFRWMMEMIRCEYIRYQIYKMERTSFVLPKSVIPCLGIYI